jgi:hypothetical protein
VASQERLEGARNEEAGRVREDENPGEGAYPVSQRAGRDEEKEQDCFDDESCPKSGEGRVAKRRIHKV